MNDQVQNTEEPATTKDVLDLIACTEWAQLQKLGLWDIVYDSGESKTQMFILFVIISDWCRSLS